MGGVLRGFSVFLPWPPSTNRLWRAVGRGRAISSENYRKWKKEASAAIMLQRPTPIPGPVKIRVELTPPTKREYDPDNKIKALFDAIVGHGLIKTDSNRTIKTHTVVESSAEQPGAVLIVEPCT